MTEETKTIQLRKPIIIGKEGAAITYSEITLREPVSGELEKAQLASTPVGSNITLIAIVAKIPRTVAEKLCQRDLREASDFLASFSDDGETSETTGTD